MQRQAPLSMYSDPACPASPRPWALRAPGERGVRAEDVGAAAARALAEDLACGACVDRWAQDQLVVFMALAAGTSRLLCGEPTLHTRTALAVARQAAGARVELARAGAAWRLEVTGMGVLAGGHAG